MIVYDLGVLRHVGPKNHTRKIDKIHKSVEIYQLLMHNFLGQKVRIFPCMYCLQKESTHFFLGILISFSLEVLLHFRLKKLYKKN